MTINDLRLIISPHKEIRIWDNNQPKELINPKVLFSGNISDLAFTDKIAKETIIEMLPISNVLVFYINHREEVVGRKDFDDKVNFIAFA